MGTSSTRVLVVEDYEPFRRFLISTLRNGWEGLDIHEVSDGLKAVQEAQRLRPDLILLDIGLPTLNGFEAARQICALSPTSKIIFVTQESSADMAQEALKIGACGYVVKTDAGSELIAAVTAVLRGEQFVSASLAGNDLTDPKDEQTADHNRGGIVLPYPPQNIGITHEVGFYSGDRHFLDHVKRFIGAALKAGNAAIIVATESHRESLLLELQAEGLDMGKAIEEGRYIPLDAADTLSVFMVNGMPDPVRFLELLGDLIVTAREAAKGTNPRVSVFGECVHLLWAQGKETAAIQVEKLGNKLTHIHAVDILCGYSLGIMGSEMDSHTFEQICAEHSAVYSQ